MRWSKNVKIQNISEKLLNISALMKEASETLPKIFDESPGYKEIEKNIAKEAYNLKPKNDKR